MSVLRHFPLSVPPRQIQADAIEQAHAAFQSGKRFVLLEGPPGLGKSAAAVTLAREYGKTYICTLTKQLQSQYLSDFHRLGARELKGKANYWCEDEDTTCETGCDRRKGDNACRLCPYRLAKAAALAAPIMVCNYSSYMFNVSGIWGAQRPLLVLDEAHETEGVLMDFVSVSVDASTLPIPVSTPFPNAGDANACFDWLLDFLAEAYETDPEELSEKAKKEFDRLVKKAEYALMLRGKEKWISETLERRTGFVLKPLTVRSFGDRLFRYGERVLLMSATILDAEAMADSLGISKDDYAFIRAPCPFPVANRPVFVGGLDMTKKARSYSWPAMLEQIADIMGAHEKEKGLILTPSNEMLRYIEEGLPPSLRRRIIAAHGADRMKSYQQHLDSKQPTVIMASGLWEGADLKGDYSRFQIVPAVPRPFWGGQVAARAKGDPRWYRWRTYCQLIQGLGRSVRSETDSATSYVLDVDLKNEAGRSDSMLPDWFLEALEFT